MKLVLSLIKIALVGAALGLASCNTVQGIGQDIESAGRAVEGTAERDY